MTNKKLISALVFLIILPLLFFYFAKKNYPITGDGKEYILMSQGISSHLSPELTQNDASNVLHYFKKSDANFNDPFFECATERVCIEKNIKNHAYFESKSGDYYSWHFFGYSAINAPAYFFYQKLGKSPTVSFAFTNSVFILLAIILIIVKLKESYFYKIILIMTTLTPTTFKYLNWNHPESITFSSIIIALIYFKEKKPITSSLIFAACSMQNPPLAFAAVIIFIYSVKIDMGFGQKLKDSILRLSPSFIKHLFFGALMSAIILMPSIFYYHKYGISNLIVANGYSDKSLISLNRLWEFYFDLNQGMILLVPFSLIALLLLVFNIPKINRSESLQLSFLFLFISIITAIPCLTTPNWNPGGSDVLRYVYWNSVFIVFSFAELINSYTKESSKRILLSLYVLSHLIVLLMINQTKWFARDSSQLSLPAKFMIENHPRFYNPTNEIIVERSINSEINARDYFKKGKSLMVIKDGNLVKEMGNSSQTVPTCVFRSVSIVENILYKNIAAGCLLFRDKISGVIPYPLPTASLLSPINFNLENLNYSIGWSVVENGFRWSDGDESYIPFDFDFNSPMPSQLKLNGFLYQDDTEVSILLNGNKIFDGKLDLIKGSLKLPISKGSLFKKNNILKIIWKNPAKPNNGDFRHISFAFKSLEFLQ
ncbi:hypothetical protein K5Y32_14930 [Pantoea sp. DY-15]|uniref:hypothetical protein n=1 Tax=Pantoea sp. DY-15 TaxID=2871489 RepID=UPI001C9387DD|nr:hypothetical protein [Pantoea sp. DY-15]MBY4889239.1 hypothetical protein [Pantoea sp. DY-15]